MTNLITICCVKRRETNKSLTYSYGRGLLITAVDYRLSIHWFNISLGVQMVSVLTHLLMVLRSHCFTLTCQKIGKIKDMCLHNFKNCGYVIYFIVINSPKHIDVQFTAQCDKDMQFICDGVKIWVRNWKGKPNWYLITYFDHEKNQDLWKIRQTLNEVF